MKTTKTLSVLVAIVACAILSINQVVAQSYVTLQTDTATLHFSGVYAFTNAYNTAIPGDTIYLPGGTFAAPSYINKNITVYGAGFWPDSTAVTEKTILYNEIRNSADKVYFEGIEFVDEFNYAYNLNHGTINEVQFIRCHFRNYLTNYDRNGYDGTVVRLYISGSVMWSANFSNVANLFLKNNIIRSYINSIANAQITNNVFLYNSSGAALSSISGSVVKDNIFITSRSAISSERGNIFEDNIFINSQEFENNSTDKGNYTGVAQADVFVNQTGFEFDYTHDYHLKSPETYIGSDGTQVGIYGGLFPWKEGAVPSTPHIRSNNTSKETDETGKLQLDIVVSAQGEID